MKDYLNAISLLPDEYKNVLSGIPEKMAVTIKAGAKLKEALN